jgi:hypothetical protein
MAEDPELNEVINLETYKVPFRRSMAVVEVHPVQLLKARTSGYEQGYIDGLKDGLAIADEQKEIEDEDERRTDF